MQHRQQVASNSRLNLDESVSLNPTANHLSVHHNTELNDIASW